MFRNVGQFVFCGKDTLNAKHDSSLPRRSALLDRLRARGRIPSCVTKAKWFIR
jgi:hypothetical protein